jgi:hypothetical protein
MAQPSTAALPSSRAAGAEAASNALAPEDERLDFMKAGFAQNGKNFAERDSFDK